MKDKYIRFTKAACCNCKNNCLLSKYTENLIRRKGYDDVLGFINDDGYKSLLRAMADPKYYHVSRKQISETFHEIENAERKFYRKSETKYQKHPENMNEEIDNKIEEGYYAIQERNSD